MSVPLSEGEVFHPTYTAGTYDYRGTAYAGNVEYAISKTFINQYGGYYIDKYTLSKVYNTEGYTDGTIIPDETNYRYGIRYNYYRRDHLGNNREVWATEQVNYGGIIPAFTSQRTQYYPSGLPWAEGEGASVQNKKYNGKEFIEMHGYDTYDIVWRQYYPAIMRFQTPDPEAEEDYDISPYAMCGNNMVINTDPDGRIWNYVIGAVVGAGIDYASQVAVNLVEGKGIQESLTQVDGKSIAISAVAGATGVGLASLTQKATTIYKLGKASTKIIETTASVVTDATISAGSQYTKDGKVSAKAVAIDVVAGQAGRGVGNLAKTNVQSSQKGVSYQKQANRTAGKAMYNPNTAKTARAEAAAAKSNNYGSKTETAVSSATSNTISTGYETVKKIKEERR